MVITANIGNTHLHLGAFSESGEMLFASALSTQKKGTAYDYAAGIKQAISTCGAQGQLVTGAILSSVVPSLTSVVKKGLELLFHCRVLTLSPGLKTGLNIKVQVAGNLGSDFVAAAVAAVKDHPCPLVIVSLGTATTLTAVDGAGCLLGTAIMPGVQLSQEALREKAACLPEVDMQAPESVVGTNTVDAMRSGLIFGTASMLDGMVARFEEKLGARATCIITGSYAKEICPYCKGQYQVDEHLLLRGLWYIYQRNCKKPL